MRIEESPPILKLIEKNKKSPDLLETGAFCACDVQRYRQQETATLLRCFLPVLR